MRADRGRRGARRRRRAARPLGDARRRARAAVARDPALHRHHAGDGRRGAGRRARAARPRRAARGPGARRAQRRRSTGACCARRSSAPSSSGRTRRRCARSRWRAGSRRSSRQRKLAALAGSLGIEVEVSHRALADAETCARVFCALFPRLCANAATVGDALEALRPKRGARPQRPTLARAGARCTGPTSATCPTTPGVYIFRNAEGQPLYVGKSVRAALARALALRAVVADAATGPRRRRSSTTARRGRSSARCCSRAGSSRRCARRATSSSSTRTATSTCAAGSTSPFPVLEVAPEPAAGHAVNIGPLRGRAVAVELKEQLDSLFGLRHCGAHAAAPLPRRRPTGRWGAACRRASATSTRTSTAAAWTRRSGCSPAVRRRRRGAARARRRGRCARRRAERRFERAAWLRRRHARLRVLLERLGPFLRAAHAHPAAGAGGEDGVDGRRRVLARRRAGRRLGRRSRRPTRSSSAPRRRCARAPSRTSRPTRCDELRIVSTWLAAHDAGRARPRAAAVQPAAARASPQRSGA